MKKQKSSAPASVDNIYKLDGRVPVAKAIPFGLQHVLAMFVANVTPVMLIASVAVYNGQAFTAIDTALLIQAAMLIAGIGTLIQLYPVWRIGSRLPVVMGLSFTFLSAMMTLASRDYGLMIGAVIVGGCIEGLLGLTARYWRHFVSPIVSACVVTTIGFSLLSTGISSFASSSAYPTGAWQNLLVGFADDNAGKADNDCTGTGSNVCIAHILCIHCSGKSNTAVCKCKGNPFHFVGIY